MTSRPDNDNPVWELADAVLNESINEADLDRLVKILETDPIARSFYVDYCELHASLTFTAHANHATGEAFSKIKHSLGSTVDQRTETSSSPAVNLPARERPTVVRRLPVTGLPVSSMTIFTVLATTIVLISGLQFLGMLNWPVSPPVAIKNQDPVPGIRRIAPTTSNQSIAATLTGLVDCKWKNAISAPSYGEPLYGRRQLVLESGLAQVTFESGAKLIVQGPAEFTVISEMEGNLETGKLTAIVPKSAYGFTVRSPTAEVIDLGTEFGMDVDETGRTEVHVFKGEVVSFEKNKQGEVSLSNHHVVEDQSVTFDVGSHESGKAIASKFVRNIAPQLASEQVSQFPEKKKLALWLAADILVETDDDQRVIAWQDILVGDNQSEENAWQYSPSHRPRLVENAIGGKSALRFDGESSFLVTTPLTTTDDQTVFIVHSPGEGALDRSTGGQLLNYNGPPHRYIMPSGSKGVLQVGDLASIKPEIQKVGFYRGHVFAGWKEKRAINVGSIYSAEKFKVNSPTICAYQYSMTYGKSELFVNGVSQGASTAPSSIAVTSRKVIGRHAAQELYFLGDIAEVLIYNSALSPDKIAQVHQYLGDKYKIELNNTK